jgi:thioesterase domain-containing protein
VRARNWRLLGKLARESRAGYYVRRIGALTTTPGAVRLTGVVRALVERVVRRDGAARTPSRFGPSRLLQAYRRRMAVYRPGPFAGSAMLFWPEEEPAVRGDDATLGWGRICAGIRVVRVPGGHHSCLTTHVDVLATTLRAWLEDVPPGD